MRQRVHTFLLVGIAALMAVLALRPVVTPSPVSAAEGFTPNYQVIGDAIYVKDQFHNLYTWEAKTLKYRGRILYDPNGPPYFTAQPGQ